MKKFAVIQADLYIEAIQITFDDEVISYGELLNIYWKQIDQRIVVVNLMTEVINIRL